MSQYIKLLSDISFMTGLIGYPEYIERCEVADWLEDSGNHISDPRISNEDNEESHSEDDYRDDSHEIEERPSKSSNPGNDDSPWLELLMMNQWMFTIGDEDCYPSVPHGHFQKKTRKWPKLNPYTGRVFTDVHKENAGMRLKKRDMRELWSDPDFIGHCRKQVLWYSDFAPSYGFPRARRGKLIFPKWR
ncbi:MAG: hypothetical protein GY814_03260 [Gammaproteobacteria bacterium]|nr:hypothetical protein [Gammaproteobacteria bacterium]